MDYLNPENEPEYIKKLTIIWGAKECIFKIKNEEGISFKNHISVEPFELSQNQTLAKLHIPETICSFEIHFESIEEFALVYAFIKK